MDQHRSAFFSSVKSKNHQENKIIMESSTHWIFETNNFALETFIHVHDIR